jgi:hypothetical protein
VPFSFIATAFTLAATLASPAPAPQYPVQTPPPEPNHVTIDVVQSVLDTSGYEWENGHGYSTQAAVRYEFQATPKARFANTLHWERLSSVYAPADFPNKSWWFDYVEYDDEFDAELGRPDYPLGVGVGYFDYSPVYDFKNTYNLRGFGIGFDRWPNYYTFHSLYYSLWYYPDVRGGHIQAGAYGIVRGDVGINFRPDLMRPWNVRLGFASDTWFAKNAFATDTGFNGPYIGFSFWR